MFTLAYFTIGGWIGYQVYFQTLDVLTGDQDTETADVVIAAGLTFTAIIIWPVFIAGAIALKIRDR